MSICEPSKLFFNILEWLEIYEPNIDIEEASARLLAVKQTWNEFQGEQRGVMPGMMNVPMTPFVQKAAQLIDVDEIDQPVAVDLGCGLGSTPYQLCDRGWKVYAVDSSKEVLKAIKNTVENEFKKDWIEEEKLVLVHQNIENFEYPENVHLITATASLPYCDPTKILSIFHKAKNALVEGGVFAAEFFAHNSNNPQADFLMQNMFGGWVTTRNVIEAVANFTDFSSVSVEYGKSPAGLAPQVHMITKG